MELNVLKLIFVGMTSFIVIMGTLINFFEKYLPAIFPEIFRYGKFAYTGKSSIFKGFQVPKRWFRHFYVYSTVHSAFALYWVINVYLYGVPPPKWLVRHLDFFCGSNRHTETSSTAVIIALTLFTLQSIRRFYESWFVSVYSNGKLHVTQYLIGFLYHWGVITIMLAEAAGFDRPRAIGKKFDFSPSFIQACGIKLFVFASFNQYKTAVTLANLRKNSKDEIVTTEHKMPEGGLFKYVSSPHLMCEILIYVALWLILFNNHTFQHVLLFVVSNQVETAMLNHWWYLNTFKDYPKERKAIIPFVF